MKLKLKKYARTMIIANVDIKDPIVNGSMGTVIDFIHTESGEIRSIIVVFDDPETGVDQMARHRSKEGFQSSDPI